MKNRLDQWIAVVGFCAFLGVVVALYLLLPKSEFSEMEKRYLQTPPVLSVDSLTSGDFGADVDKFMADHIPGRDFFVGLNAYVDLLTGRQITKDVYVAEGDRLVEKPVVWNAEQAEKNVKAVNTFAAQLGRSVQFMIVPSAGWAVADQIRGLADPYEDPILIKKLYDLAEDNVNCVDVVSAFEQVEDKASLYFKTDHHWTSFGAYTAYAHLMQVLEKPYPAVQDFHVKTAADFKGSTFSRAALWLTPGEPLEMWSFSENLQVTNGESEAVHNGIFYENRLLEADKYTVFLDGNHSIVRIENPDNAGKGKILVVRDSYSNCLGGFLAESYETVVLVDLRYYKDSVQALCTEQGFDDILVCYSLSNFMTDNNLIYLKEIQQEGL